MEKKQSADDAVLNLRTVSAAQRDLAAIAAYVEQKRSEKAKDAAWAALPTPICDAVEEELRLSPSILANVKPGPGWEKAVGIPQSYKDFVANPPATFSESWENYKRALYGISSAVSLATSLIRNEQFRTPVDSDVWDTLGELARKAAEIREHLAKEIERVPERGEVA